MAEVAVEAQIEEISHHGQILNCNDRLKMPIVAVLVAIRFEELF
jgi:hypothetical protein